MGSFFSKTTSRSIEDYRPNCSRIGDDVMVKWKVSTTIHESPDCKYLVVVAPVNRNPLVTVVNTETLQCFQITLQIDSSNFATVAKGGYSRVEFDQDGKRIYVRINLSNGETTTINLETESVIADDPTSRNIISYSVDNYNSVRYYAKIVRTNFDGRDSYGEGVISNRAHVLDEQKQVVKEIQHDTNMHLCKIVDDKFVFTRSFGEARLTKIN